jgi:hypothetical protein
MRKRNFLSLGILVFALVIVARAYWISVKASSLVPQEASLQFTKANLICTLGALLLNGFVVAFFTVRAITDAERTELYRE